ncbi:tail tube-associated base plate wedge protein [Caulobacter phage Cr30]|uniref:tail tube-associated base plate wedge protein n=1 Tax=Caulobacter phage Cr30 TaxID=1357714 RepID=UPI0004A9B3C9|nr:tail tube-associated base plate wedge protein [Caulobacter phage Cr30]AGS81114.1 tail tube-associated base plate wedge protein [Caulobacter phage Cr30]
MANKTIDPRTWISRKELKGNKTLSFPVNLDATVPHFFEIKFVNYERNASLEKAKQTPNSVTIFLPTPANIRDTTSLEFDEYESFGGLDNILEAPTSSQQVAAAKESGMGFLGAAVLGTLRHFSETGTNKLTKGLTGDGSLGSRVSKVAQSQAGAIINPALAVEFHGVQRKNYQFSWRMVATTAEESQKINQIIDCIRWNALPERVSGDWILTYPNIAFMKFHGTQSYGNPQTPRQMIQFGPQGSFVSSINIEVNGSSATQVFFKDTGEPVEISISINFQDRGIVTREMVDSSWQN